MLKLKLLLWIGLVFVSILNVIAQESLESEEQDANLSSVWVSLLDTDLSFWETYIGVPHVSVTGLENHPKSENVHVGIPIGLADPKKVFTVKEIDETLVLHVSGEIYGGLTSKQSFQNYHLKFQYKWGEKKWEPRLDKKRDSGLLYHCTGEHGAFWNVWMRSLEYQIQEGDTGDFIALAGAHAMVYSNETPTGEQYQYQGGTPLLGVGPHYGNWGCKKSHTNENDTWNTVELFCIGPDAIHVINGQVVNVIRNAHLFEGDTKTPLIKGKIQLQSEAAEIFFKEIQIKELTDFPTEYLELFKG